MHRYGMPQTALESITMTRHDRGAIVKVLSLRVGGSGAIESRTKTIRRMKHLGVYFLIHLPRVLQG